MGEVVEFPKTRIDNNGITKVTKIVDGRPIELIDTDTVPSHLMTRYFPRWYDPPKPDDPPVDVD